MKIFLTTAMALGSLCILETNQPAKAEISDSPNFHFARGRGGYRGEIGHEVGRTEDVGRDDGGYRGEIGREADRGEDAGRDDGGYRGEIGREAKTPTIDHPAAVERIHTPDEDNPIHSRTLNQDDRFLRNEDGWVGTDGCILDENGNCTVPETVVNPITTN